MQEPTPGQSGEQKIELTLPERFDQRNEDMTAETKAHSEMLRERVGEELAPNALASLINSHENLNNIFRNAANYVETPEEISAYLKVVQETITALTESLSYGISGDIYERQKALIENPGELPRAIKKSVKEIAGSAGPSQTRNVGEIKV